MDRYVIREQRSGGEYPEGNQMIAFSATTNSTGNNITIPENMFFGRYGGEVRTTKIQQPGTHRLVTPHMQAYWPNVIQAQTQIDPRYLAYVENDATYAQTMHGSGMPPPTAFQTFGRDYNNYNFAGAQTNKRDVNRALSNNHVFNKADSNIQNFNKAPLNNENFNGVQLTNMNFGANNSNFNRIENDHHNFNGASPINDINRAPVNNYNRIGHENKRIVNKGTDAKVRHFKAADGNNGDFKGTEKNDKHLTQTKPNVASAKQTEIDLLRHELQNQVKTRAEKLKELHKAGTRILSGPVEKILKWHKSIQDIGVVVLYEIVGKCVNVRAGEKCAKNLVVRDENGPAIQVVYYEIDFLLPELKPPCTVRVIGRMMPGTNRFQAFNVRPATGDDVATLPRRAAVAAHHVAKLCKEYGVEVGSDAGKITSLPTGYVGLTGGQTGDQNTHKNPALLLRVAWWLVHAW